MNAASPFFKLNHPFRKSPELISASFSDGQDTFSLRPFWITGDLRLVYQWLNDPSTIQNNAMQKDASGLIFYFRSLLESDNAQAFLITMDSNPVCQISLFPAQEDALLPKNFAKADDYTVRYLLPFFRNGTELFTNSLLLLLRYYSAFSVPGRLLLRIENADTVSAEAAAGAGFQLLAVFPEGVLYQMK